MMMMIQQLLVVEGIVIASTMQESHTENSDDKNDICEKKPLHHSKRTHSFHSLRQLISVAVNVTCLPFIAIDRVLPSSHCGR